ncbi:hypothetical protein KKH23_02490 [Patescibacteria group bacterium]|nr:hypothetical protein [Patescibacteria group bacterium]MBU0777408.1 hypothetical protein [Patescibacteria group bacterium]MBU0846044.1 hypothetical protein [Patescibacteria group bacterium]MBU0922456.1 hypothetical protein [Patescibacteria group bacterium]MBU1066811.1 hypothetical protein [Patescibacteria group bacterium]
MDFSLEKKNWWEYLGKDLQGLLREATLLLEKVSLWDEKFHDYSFIVFPAAKAYEGFLKLVFLERGFISEEDYYGKRFRVGKALNPSLERRLRAKESVYDKIVQFCGGKDLADKMWNTWKVCRNLLFHWFPNERNAIDFDQAKTKVDLIIETIDTTFKDCKIELTNS